MPYNFDDFQAEYNQHITGENFASEVADLKIVSASDAKTLFPEIALSESPSVVYFPFKLCHSLPKVNRRGRSFTGKVLARSLASAVDSLIDVEHAIVANNSSPEDHICGHIKAAKLQLAEVANQAELADIPAMPIPVIGLGCLYLRAQEIKDIVTNHITGREKWAVSMECGHDLKETCILWDNKFIPLPEAEEGMLRCIKPTSMLPFREKQTILSLGGLGGTVDFWGAGLTKTPADGDATIFSFVGAKSREAASAVNKKTFYMPLRYYGEGLEVANVGKKIEELASIAVLGETDESDGHKHIVLTDMTILPTNGHVHSMRTVSLTAGTKPTLTGVTDTHYEHLRGSSDEMSRPHVHQHVVNIPLNKKNKAAPSADTDVTLSPEDSANLKKIGEIANMAKSLQELMTDLNTKLGEMANLKDAAAISAKGAEIASLQKDVATLTAESATTQKINEAIEAQIKAGSLLRKEQADAAVLAAKTEAELKAEQEKKAIERKANRLEQIRAAGIDLNFGLPDMKNADGTPMTIGDAVNSLPADESGDSQFALHLSSWKAMLAQAKEVQGVKDTQQKLQEAASIGSQKVVSKSIIAAGGGSTRDGGSGTAVEAPPRNSLAAMRQGKSRFTR